MLRLESVVAVLCTGGAGLHVREHAAGDHNGAPPQCLRTECLREAIGSGACARYSKALANPVRAGPLANGLPGRKEGKRQVGQKSGDAPLRAESRCRELGLGLGLGRCRRALAHFENRSLGRRVRSASHLARTAPDGLRERSFCGTSLLDVVVSATYLSIGYHGVFTFMPLAKDTREKVSSEQGNV